MDFGWIKGGYSADKVPLYPVIIHWISGLCRHSSHAQSLSTRHLVPVYTISAQNQDFYHHQQFIQRVTRVSLDKLRIEPGYPHIIQALSEGRFTHNFGMDKVKIKPGYPGFICVSSTYKNTHDLAWIKSG